jgi:hypothetical protein
MKDRELRSRTISSKPSDAALSTARLTAGAVD